jgi:hypothetical protein
MITNLPLLLDDNHSNEIDIHKILNKFIKPKFLLQI